VAFYILIFNKKHSQIFDAFELCAGIIADQLMAIGFRCF
jgi:hypothetical protein